MSKTHFEIACRSYPGMTVLWQRLFSIMMFDQTHCMYQYSKTRLYCDSKKKTSYLKCACIDVKKLYKLKTDSTSCNSNNFRAIRYKALNNMCQLYCVIVTSKFDLVIIIALLHFNLNLSDCVFL